jgi:hypothetical protein
VAAILKVIVGVIKDWPKKGRRVATVDKSCKEVLQVSLLLSHILDQLEKKEDHSVDHTFQDARCAR